MKLPETKFGIGDAVCAIDHDLKTTEGTVERINVTISSDGEATIGYMIASNGQTSYHYEGECYNNREEIIDKINGQA